jgi:hypothetical protein
MTPPNAFGDDLAFLHQHAETIVLSDEDQKAQVVLVPAWQGRVVTSTTGGETGFSLGWINRQLIASQKQAPKFNPLGGEDRFWLGPEGSQYSVYFPVSAEFTAANWFVPEALDVLPFRTAYSSRYSALFQAEFGVTSHAGSRFEVGVSREIRLFDRDQAWRVLGSKPVNRVSIVAHQSRNTLVNVGPHQWTEGNGLLSIWILGMFNASPSTTIVVPIKMEREDAGSFPVTTYESFGSIPGDRLLLKQDAVFFRGDARFRAKIGIKPTRSRRCLGSYDANHGVLTVVQFTQPEGLVEYANNQWGDQLEPYGGDVINSYNDGPPVPGAKQLGDFYELESSSPVQELRPGESLEHTHRTFHLTGTQADLDRVARTVFGVGLVDIERALPES